MSTPSRPGERRSDDAATRELLGAWALDAVDPDERAAVEDLLSRDPEAAREARSLLETSALLGDAVARPAPAAVRDATLAAVLRTTPEGAGPDAVPESAVPADPEPAGTAHVAPVGPRPPRPSDARPAGTPGGSSTRPGGRPASGRPGTSRAGSDGTAGDRTGNRSRGDRPARRRTWRVLASALVLALAVAVPSVIAVRESQRATRAEARADRIAELLAEPGATIAAAEVTTGGTAIAVVTTDAALLTASGLTDPGAGKVYQLWVMRDGVPVPGATSTVDAGALQVGTDAYRTGDALALTVEPAGGSPAPTTEPVVVLAPA